VVRRLASRDDWAERRAAQMTAPVVVAPQRLVASAAAQGSGVPEGPRTFAQWREALGLSGDDATARQRGGRPQALDTLQDFLVRRSAHYRGGISSPLSAADACSRLSPYLAWGCLSLREVVQATERRIASLPPTAPQQRQGLRAFAQRLAWHCHFIQKLETEPTLEWHNLHRGYDGLREGEHRADHLLALQQGRTGWPLVDACVAMLRETGWLNFRMRAMLVSVAAYPLWLHWRPVGLWLAQQFVDYEPGIHWSQMQMQSGTTGINTTRIYNPIKQAHDWDPNGRFVRHWLPAMRRVPDAWLFEPWRMPEAIAQRCGLRLGHDIPLPLVDLAVATQAAKLRFYARRSLPSVKALERGIVERHGARGPRPEHTGRTKAAGDSVPGARQGDLF